MKILPFLLLSPTLLLLLLHKPTPLDQPVDIFFLPTISITFLFWAAGLCGWGKKLCAFFKLPHCSFPEYALTGSLLYAWVGFLLASLNVLSPNLFWPTLCFQAVGLFFLPSLPLRKKVYPHHLLWLPLSALALLCLLDAYVLHSYWDPLHHHLASIRLWWENGGLYFPPFHISAYQEGGVELLFFWPHFFFAGKGSVPSIGIAEVQIFSQLIHLSAWISCALVVDKWSKRFVPSTWSIIAALCFCLPASLQFAIPMAKNDWGIIFWVCGALLFYHKGLPGLFLAGLSCGMAFMGKYTSAFALIAVLPAMFFSSPFKGRLFLLVGFCCGALPLFFRNLLATGNPFFPLLSDWFTTANYALGPTWKEALRTYQQPAFSFKRISDLLYEHQLTPLIPFSLIWILWRKKDLRVLTLGAIFGLIFFFVLTGESAEARLLGALLPLLLALSIIALYFWINFLLPRSHTYAFLLALLLLPFLPYRWNALKRAPLIPHPEIAARSYTGGSSQAWFRSQYQPGMKCALLSDSRIYHSLPFPMVRIWDYPALDRELRDTSELSSFFATLKKYGFTHLLLTSEKIDLFYPPQLVSQVEAFVLSRPNAILYRAKESLVADVTVLYKEAISFAAGETE